MSIKPAGNIFRPTPPSTPNPRGAGHVEELLEGAINNRENDYTYHSGWSGELITWQPKLDADEAKALIAEISNLKGPTTAEELLTELHRRSTEAGLASASLALTEEGAAALTAFASERGLDLVFEFNQPPPFHPVG
jgi:hypothetical protein